MKRSALASGLVLLAVCACSSPPERNPNLGGPPANVSGFPSNTHEGIVFASARFELDASGQLKRDFVRADKIVPVYLEVKLRGEGAETAKYQLTDELWEPRLVLQDGSVLPGLTVDEVVSRLDENVAKIVRSKAFDPALIDQTLSGYVFFQLEPKPDYRVEREQLVHNKRGLSRGVSIAESLLVFRISKEDVLDDFYVGIRP